VSPVFTKKGKKKGERRKMAQKDRPWQSEVTEKKEKKGKGERILYWGGKMERTNFRRTEGKTTISLNKKTNLSIL